MSTEFKTVLLTAAGCAIAIIVLNMFDSSASA
jgi:hypothetical protein